MQGHDLDRDRRVVGGIDHADLRRLQRLPGSQGLGVVEHGVELVQRLLDVGPAGLEVPLEPGDVALEQPVDVLEVGDLVEQSGPLVLVGLRELLDHGVDPVLGLFPGRVEHLGPLGGRLAQQTLAVGHRLGGHLVGLVPGIGQQGVGLELGLVAQPLRLFLGLPHEGVGGALGVDQGVAQRLVEVGHRPGRRPGRDRRLRGAPGFDQTGLGRGRPGLRFSQPGVQLLDLVGQRGEVRQHPVDLILAVTPGLFLEPDVRDPPEQPELVTLLGHRDRVAVPTRHMHGIDLPACPFNSAPLVGQWDEGDRT